MADELTEVPPIKTFLHIIVLGYGNFHQTTEKCLNSILKERHRSDILITAIDNGSLDNSALELESYLKDYPEINLKILPQNLGFAGGMNHGVSLAEAEWVCLLGSDTVFSPQAFQILYQSLKDIEQSVGIVGPVSNEAGTSQKLYFCNQLPDQIFNEFQKKCNVLLGIRTPLYRADFFCVAIRKSLWDILGGLDLSYGRGYYEDFDFCMRAKKLHYQILMLEDMMVYHAGSMSFKNDPTQKKLIKNNKKIFIKKFPNAELRHTRADQLKTIEYYLSFSKERPTQIELEGRIFWRLQTIEEDLPRSFWKKMKWQRKVKEIYEKLCCES
jgi:GT2 family glycosyltransferase